MRRKRKFDRPIIPDSKYNDVLVSKFINNLMWDGKKSDARSVMYGALQRIGKVNKESDPVAVFHTAMSNVTPLVEVKSRRVGGANYQVPIEVRGGRKDALAMRWLIDAARSKKGKPMAEKLADEILLAFKKEGEAMKKRENVHKMAEANKAFAHFAW